MDSRTKALLVGLLVLGLSGCATQDDPAARAQEAAATAVEGPRLRALGTAQDGGLPHASCSCARCERARRDPSYARRVSSLALLLPESHEVYLIDATPDIRSQLDALGDVRPRPRDRAQRDPVDGILLTHAHLGHYTGLAFFGYEAVQTQSLPVFCTPAMAAYLRTNGPWSQLVEFDNISLNEVRPGEPFSPSNPVSITALQVPHRDEFADTIGFILRGPRRTALYVPDTSRWSDWDPDLLTQLDAHRIDLAILDGTFFSPDELPGRNLDDIGHPLIRTTMDLLEQRVRTSNLQVYFTHLNHTNPALDPDGPEQKEIIDRGFHILSDDQDLPL